MPRSDSSASNSSLLTLAAVAVAIAGLYFASEFLVPVAIAVLLAFLLAVPVTRLERIGIGRIPSVIIVVVIAFAVIGFVGWILTDQILDLARKLPQYQGNINAKINRLHASTGLLDGPTHVIRQVIQQLTSSAASTAATASGRPIPVELVEHAPAPIQFVKENVQLIMAPLTTIGIVVVFVIFMLIQHEDLRDRTIRLVSRGNMDVTTQALSDASARISRYLLMQLAINVGYGVPVAIGLYLIGMPNAILWGLLATLLRFLPYIGTWIAACMPILMGLAVFNDFYHVLLTIGLYVLMELITVNVLEPWLYGSSTGLSASAVVISAAFWTWLWGPAGLLLSTPMTVCLVVIGKYVPQLQFLDVMLGDEPVLQPPARVYQRLLAQDPEEAADLVDEYLEEKPLIEVYDTVLLPALGMAEEDQHRGRLDAPRHQAILTSIREVVEDLGDRMALGNVRLEPVNAEDDAAGISRRNSPTAGDFVLCLPAHDEADEIAGLMLAQVLQQAGCAARVLSVHALASEMVETTCKYQPRVVCLSALPPAASAHARYLCKRLRARMDSIRLVIGLWTTKGDIRKVQQRLNCAETDKITALLAEAVGQIKPLMVALTLKAQTVTPTTATTPG